MEYSTSGSSIFRIASQGAAKDPFMAQLKTGDLGW
jgi:hypothetical protein